MIENRIKISSIIENQLPEFVREEYPLVEEFLSQYYLSLESQGSSSDLIQNIDRYIKVDNLTNLVEFTHLTSNVDFFDTEILVESTYGFPESYGLILIDDEIITYTGKTEKSFTGCIRGFVGTTSLKSSIKDDQLVFEDSEASEHQSIINEDKTKVFNLSILFLKEFFIKIKKQITPGLENKDFYENLNENLFIKESNSLYASKGTETSFKILFGALYGVVPKVILPRDYLIQPSDAQFRITQDLVVESISGNPLELINGTLYQDASSDGIFSDSRGTITDVKRISRGGKIYYTISLDSGYDKDIDVFGSIKSNFKIHPKTKLTSEIKENSTYLDVDSTIGFPTSGELVVDLDLDLDGVEETPFVIAYKSKTLTQFLECSGILLPLSQGTEVKINNFAYGTNLNNEKITVRITGVVSGVDSFETNAYYEKGDIISIKTLGEDCKTERENNWFFNIATNYNISSILDLNPIQNGNTLSKDLKVTLFDNHSFVRGDKVGIFFSTSEEYSGEVIEINNSKEIIIKTDLNVPFSASLASKIIKKISKLNVNESTVKNSDESTILTYKTYNTNVKNTYVDLKNSLYVTSTSLPSYLNQSINIDDFSYKFSDVSLPENNYTITINSSTVLIDNTRKHCYYTGDAVIFKPSTESTIQIDGIGLTTSLYYVKVVDDNTIKLSRSRENIFKNEFVKVTGKLTGCKLELLEFNDNNFNSLKLKPQSLIKKISEPELIDTKEETIPGTTGIFVNGVELLNYKSTDKIFYGPIEDIEITSGGNEYDLINPPNMVITDITGSDCSAYCSVIGELKRFDIIDPGFDYIEEPSVTISGGNGSGARAKVRTIGFTHAPEFNSKTVNIANNTIEFFEPHKFRDNEKVIYETDGQKSILGLTTNSEYYVSIVDQFSVKLHSSFSDSVLGINNVIFNEEGLGFHRLKSSTIKKKISSVEVLSPGVGYQNKKTKVSGINTASDVLRIINHGYSSGEIVTYYPQSTPIVGLTSSKSYYVTKISNDEIKLSEIGSPENPQIFYNNKQYINLTTTSSLNHYFNYPPITISLNGKVGISSTSGQDYYGKIVPVFRGKIQSVFVENGGVGYGSSDIINFDRQPSIFLVEGSGAQLTAIVKEGSIEKVIVQSPGLNYRSTPDIIVKGSGFGAVLVPIISNGSISEVKVISGGFGYSEKDTFISVLNPGKGATFKSTIRSWRINLVEKYISKQKIYPDDGIVSRSLDSLQYVHLYPSRSLRSSIYSKSLINNSQNYTPDLQLNFNGREITSNTHSPIIGWAYDGNPIYGPYGFSAGNSGPIKLLKSGYSRKQGNRSNGPSINLYPLGTFVEDYEFTGSGDLDEYNGRYCSTPEFPNGVYAYFTTLSSANVGLYRIPEFPYVIGNYYKNKPIEFNFNQSKTIDENYFYENKLLRNTTPYNLLDKNSGYDFISQPNKEKKQDIEVEFTNSGTIDTINVINAGANYKVDDSIILDDNSISGKVTRVKGKNISSITSNTFSIDNFEFYPYRNLGEFIGISSVPHNLLNNSLVTLTSKYEYKNVDRVQVIENTLTLSENISDVATTGLVTTFKVYGNLDFPVKENDLYRLGSEIIKILNIDSINYKIRVLRSVNSSVGTLHTAGDSLNSLSRKVLFNTGIKSDSYNYKVNSEYYFNPQTSVGLGLTSGVGITSTLFFSVNLLNVPITIQKGAETTIYFNNQNDIIKFSSGGYVDIVNASNIEYNSTKKRITSIGNTSIKIDFDTSSFPGTIITANMNKWDILNIPTKSIYLPNHKLNTGDKLIYDSYNGTPLFISTNTTTSFALQKNSIVYAVKLSNDLIGISTLPVSINVNGKISGIGKTNDTVYFSGIGTGVYHSFKTDYSNILKGSLSRNISTVTTQSAHELNLNDSVYINVESGISTTIKLIYNDTNRRFTTTPKSIESVNLTNNTLLIPNHNFITGEKLIYNQTSPIGGLEDNKMYYAVIIDKNTISLCKSLSESRKNLPDIVDFTSSGSGTGKVSSVNSRIEVTKYQDIVFDISDSSLSYVRNQSVRPAFDFKLFYDENFENEFGTFDLTKSGSIGVGTTSSITLKTNNLPNNLYYSLVPIDTLFIPLSKKEIYIDKEQIQNNKILLTDSEIAGKKNIVGYTTNTFSFETINPVESSFYDQNNSIIEYETNSTNSSGGIAKVSIINPNKLYNKVPKIKNIKTGIGTNAILDITTKTIGYVDSNNIIIKDIGFNYSSDITIRPKSIFPSIIRVKPFNIFESIEVISRGKNYISSPDLIALDGETNEIIDDVTLKYNISDDEVIILENTKGIGKVEPIIIPINNDNGFLIDDIYYDNINNSVTVLLDGEYNTSNFPIKINDEVFIENVNIITNSGKGYNSEFYGYKFFKVTSINPTGGTNSSFTYSLNGLLNFGEIPGEYDKRIANGTVILKSYLPVFKSKLKFVEFGKDEIVVSSNNSGIVKSWDPENNYLKVISNNNFTIGDTLVGQSSNVKCIIENIISFNTYLNIDSNSTVKQGWKLETGFLNSDNQRIYDSDYYQYFSYSVQSPINIAVWNDVVGNVNHTSGFKRFSDLLIQSEDAKNVGIETSQDLGNYYAESISSEFIDLNCVYDFDLVTENSFITNNKIKSNEIYFDSKILQDYIESIGNRVLLVDDISDKFTTTEPRPYQIIDKFELEDIRYKKYLIYAYDVLDPTRTESLFVSLLHDNVNGFLNQYSVISSEDIMGYFDFTTELDRYGLLLYYPSITERKIYKYDTFSWGIGDSLVGIASTGLNIGNISKIDYVNTIIPQNQVTPISLPGISTSQLSYKVLVTISNNSNSYYQFNEISLLHNNSEVVINEYGELNNSNLIPNYSSGIVTFSSSIEGNQLLLKLHPSVGIGTSLLVNAIITSISDVGTTSGTVEILGNILSSNFISTSMTGDIPEEKLIFTHSNRYSTTYNNILIKDKTNNKIEFIEMNTLLNNSIQESFIVEYGQLSFSDPIGTFKSEINNITGDFELYFTPYDDINYEVKVLTTIITNNQNGVTTL